MDNSIEVHFQKYFHIQDPKKINMAITELKQKLDDENIPIFKMQHFFNILNTVGSKFKNIELDENKHLGTKYKHNFLLKYGEEIKKLYKEGYSPTAILKLKCYKGIEKPRSVTIRSYLISEGLWIFNIASKSSSNMLKLQKSRKDIARLFNQNYTVDATTTWIIKHHKLDNINIQVVEENIKNEYERLNLKRECSDKIEEYINSEHNIKKILSIMKENKKYKKIVSISFIKSVKRDMLYNYYEY